jgi:hypothetical protein
VDLQRYFLFVSGVSINDQMSVEIEAESLSLVLDLILNVMTDAFVQFPLKGTYHELLRMQITYQRMRV